MVKSSQSLRLHMERSKQELASGDELGNGGHIARIESRIVSRSSATSGLARSDR
jgi:hypothetical protein